jgi:ribosomal protein L12E/L44/L45/RPP1/RPP2
MLGTSFRGELVKKLIACTLAALLVFGAFAPVTVSAATPAERQAHKAQKRQQKAQKKFAKDQQKAQKHGMKSQKKAMKNWKKSHPQ